MQDNEYKCADCGGVFEKGWTDEEAVEEKEANGWNGIDMAVVCDDCYNKIMADRCNEVGVGDNVNDRSIIEAVEYLKVMRKSVEDGKKNENLNTQCSINPTESPGFVVRVLKMVESHRETYWVTLDRSDRPKDAKPWDVGRITPYMHEEKEYADSDAERWAEFLGVKVTT